MSDTPGLSGDPPPPRVLPWWKRFWNRIVWGSQYEPSVLADYELRQTRIRTWLLRIFGALLIGIVFGCALLLGLSYVMVIDTWSIPAEQQELRLHTIGIVAGAAAFGLVGSLLLLGKAVHPAKKDEDIWKGFPSAVTEVLGELLKFLKERLVK